MPLPALIGLGVGLAGAIGKMFGRGKANRQLKSLIGKNPAYSENPLAGQRLALANTMLNARMPGAATVERNIYTNQANQFSNINRAATDASQALSIAAGVGGQTDRAFSDLGIAEAQDYQRRYGNVVNAQDAVINEGDKMYSDQVRRYQDEVALTGAMNENRQNTWGDISNMGFGIADFAMAGGFGGRGGNGLGRRGVVQPGGVGGMNRTPIGQPQFQNSTGLTPTFRQMPMSRRFTPQIRPPQQYNQLYYPQ